MNNHHTVIVVGGGPAGSSAAYTLARRGIDVCVIDKATFPRNKLCGGLLTLRSRKIFSEVFDLDWERAYEYESKGAKLFYRDALVNGFDDYKSFYLTRREIFDDYLIKEAEACGSTMRLGDGVASIDATKRTCRLHSGEELSFDFLIGADGVASLVAKTLFGSAYDRDRIGFALEMEVDRGEVERECTAPEVYFGVAQWGYGWVFPKDKTLTVGLGGLLARNGDIKKTFRDFLRMLFGRIPSGRIQGHHLPMGDYRKTPGAGNILLVGDAAGLVEPVTGEGIAFAMQSGYHAGLAIAESHRTESRFGALERYKALNTSITDALDHANRFKYLIFPKPVERIFMRALAISSQLPLRHMDLMADDLTYPQYTRILAGMAIRGTFRHAINKR